MSEDRITREQILKALGLDDNSTRQKTELEIWTAIYNEQLDWLLRNKIDVEMFKKLSIESPKDDAPLLSMRESERLVEKKQIIVDIVTREIKKLKSKAQSGKKEHGNKN